SVLSRLLLFNLVFVPSLGPDPLDPFVVLLAEGVPLFTVARGPDGFATTTGTIFLPLDGAAIGLAVETELHFAVLAVSLFIDRIVFCCAAGVDKVAAGAAGIGGTAAGTAGAAT
ncbi:hypothetical protein PMAYCL1PPCAC_29670, partial [Pristionchus mayeri]